MVFRSLILAFSLLPVLCRVEAQSTVDPRISVNVLSNRVALGEVGQLIIKVKNGDARMPQTIDAPGLEVTY